MLKSILNIIPKLSAGELSNMERSLNGRFTRVAKKFGKGLASTLAGGGVVGAAVSLVDKVLNPLQETQDAIDRTLKTADDLVTNAKQFGSTAGKLARLHAMGQATGLEPSDLDMLISKFQGAVAQAKLNPNEPSSVKQFRNDTDMVDSFFSFIQSLQKLDKNQQRLAQESVFGEKQVLKMADFLNTPDWFKLSKAIGPIGSGELDKSLNKTADLNDLKDTLKARNDLRDLLNKGSLINEGMIRQQADRQKIDLERENQNIANYKNLANISNATAEMGNMLRELTLAITGSVTKFYNLTDNVQKLSKSPLWNGIIKFIKAE